MKRWDIHYEKQDRGVYIVRFNGVILGLMGEDDAKWLVEHIRKGVARGCEGERIDFGPPLLRRLS